MADPSDSGDDDSGDSDLTTTRDIWVTTPLADGVAALERMDGHETLGQPFSYELSLVSTNPNIDLSTLLGQPMTVHVKLPPGGTRHFNGIVTRATHLDNEENYSRYAVTLEPWLALLDYQSDCRIYQDMSIPDILKDVFRRADFSDMQDSLDDGAYPKLEYVVQYRESDFHFVTRLMEHAGIYYFFAHDESKHTLILADSQSAHDTVDDYDEVEYFPQQETSRGATEHLSSWTVQQRIRSGGFAATDFDFKAPRTALLSALNRPQKYAHADTDLFDYPGDYLKKADGDTLVKTRLEERQWEHEIVQTSGDVRGIGSGDLFTLKGYPRDDQNKEYLIVSAAYAIHVGDYETSGTGGEEFHSGLSLLDSKIPFRPTIRARKHRVEGPQTAIVVGASGDEIHTDNYGRVMVQFHWDRYGMSDERSSCWVRVSQAWAGAKWGSMYIPRVGQEVIVDFLEGDPDRPIITGRVYNADNMPPYDLPANKTQSGIKSRSSKGGAPSNFNEIRFEDKKGSEELHIQAEKDESKLVKNNQTASIGVDRSLSVGSNETVSIGKNRTEKVGVDESITIGSNQTISVGANQSLSVGANRTKSVSANETVTIGANSSETVGAAQTVSIGTVLAVTVGAAMTEAIGAAKTSTVGAALAVTVGAISSETVGGNKSLSAGGSISESAGGDVSVNAGGNAGISAGKNFGASSGADFSANSGAKMAIQATDEITLTCGSATIVMKSNGDITINGNKIQVEASSDMALKGSKITEN